MSTGREPRTLVEHFFRHEFGRLVAVLTRSLGVRHPGNWDDTLYIRTAGHLYAFGEMK
jgi:hypothetical protein